MLKERVIEACNAMDNDKENSNSSPHGLEEDICIHIFSASAAMVGVCLTVIGIFQIGRLQEIGSIADNLLAVDALVFLSSCILSYIALRTRTRKRRYVIERVADLIFIGGMSLMAAVCILVAYELL
jgi:hypothetical protein